MLLIHWLATTDEISIVYALSVCCLFQEPISFFSQFVNGANLQWSTHEAVETYSSLFSP